MEPDAAAERGHAEEDAWLRTDWDAESRQLALASPSGRQPTIRVWPDAALRDCEPALACGLCSSVPGLRVNSGRALLCSTFSQVHQLDAEQLDGELAELLREKLSGILQNVGGTSPPHIPSPQRCPRPPVLAHPPQRRARPPSRHQPYSRSARSPAVSVARYAEELRLFVGAIIAFPTLWSGGPSPGADLLGLRYRHEAAAPPERVMRTGVEGPPLQRHQRLLHGAALLCFPALFASALVCRRRAGALSLLSARADDALALCAPGAGLLLGRYAWVKLDQYARVRRWSVRRRPPRSAQLSSAVARAPPTAPCPRLLPRLRRVPPRAPRAHASE